MCIHTHTSLPMQSPTSPEPQNQDQLHVSASPRVCGTFQGNNQHINIKTTSKVNKNYIRDLVLEERKWRISSP